MSDWSFLLPFAKRAVVCGPLDLTRRFNFKNVGYLICTSTQEYR